MAATTVNHTPAPSASYTTPRARNRQVSKHRPHIMRSSRVLGVNPSQAPQIFRTITFTLSFPLFSYRGTPRPRVPPCGAIVLISIIPHFTKDNPEYGHKKGSPRRVTAKTKEEEKEGILLVPSPPSLVLCLLFTPRHSTAIML